MNGHPESINTVHTRPGSVQGACLPAHSIASVSPEPNADGRGSLRGNECPPEEDADARNQTVPEPAHPFP